MFTRDELKVVKEALEEGERHSGALLGDPHYISAREKIKEAVSRLALVHKGAYRDAEPIDDFDWLNGGADVHGLMVTEEQKLAATVSLNDSLAKRNDELTKRLERLQNVQALADENDRLRLELTATGTPSSLQENEALKRLYETEKAAREVLQKQVDALKQALQSERIQRSVVESPRPQLTASEQRNVARLVGACTCTDTQQIDPECPRHGKENVIDEQQ